MQMKYECVKAVNVFGFYEIPTDYFHRPAAKALLEGKIHEPRTINFIRNMTGDGSVVSGGAFIGDFLPAISANLKNSQKLITFEPNPLSFAAAERTIAINKLTNVEISNMAVGARSGESVLEVSRSGLALGGASSIVSSESSRISDEVGETLPVAMTTIDALIPKGKRISILHLDVEGFECPALKGAQMTIAADRPVVILEGTRPELIAKFIATLNEIAGADAYKHSGSMENNGFFVAS